jgi:hypothetical protein
VLKLCQVRDPIDPDAIFARLRGGDYDWDDLRRLIRTTAPVDATAVLASLDTRFGILRDLSELERQLVADSRGGRNEPLAERLRSECQNLHRSG